MKNVLITGAGHKSFIGRNLKEFLENKYILFAPSHKELDVLNYGDMEMYVQKNEIEIIIHSAVHTPLTYGFENQLLNDMTMCLNIEKISHLVDKVLYFGSGAEYDKREDIDMVTEKDIGKRIPADAYAIAKYTMNLIARNSKNIYNLRLFGVFGKYEIWHRKFLSNICCKALHNLPLTVRQDCAFDFLYTNDLVRIVEWFIENTPQYHDYNVCHGTPYLLSEFVEMIKVSAKSSTPITFLNPGKNVSYTANNTRLVNEIKTIEFTPMETALVELLLYYKNNPHTIDINLLKNAT